MIRYLLLSLTCLYITISSSAQEEIKGIGKLKLGSPESVIAEIGYQREPINISTNTAYRKRVNKVYKGKKHFKILPDLSLQDNPDNAHFDPKVTTYYLPYYMPVAGIELKGILLSFYEGKLYEIYISMPSGVAEAFNTKYGAADIKKKTTEQIFVNGYGDEIVKYDESYRSTWDTKNENIICYEYLTKFHNHYGEERYANIFRLYYADTNKKVLEYDINYKAKHEKKKSEERLNELDEL